MPGGLTTLGFVAPTIEELLADIEAEQLATIHPSLDLSPDQPLGQINGIMAKKLVEVWEALATAYNGFNRSAAEGSLLDAIGLLTGTLRLSATKSRVVQTLNLDALAVVPAGSLVNVVGQPSVLFELETAVTATVAGNYTGIFYATVTGPVVANAGTLTQITTAVAGWNSTTNALDAEIGHNIESDAGYRLNQVAELAAPGSCTVDSIRADLLRVVGVLQAFVFENTTMSTDVDGVPAKAYECVIYDGPSPAAANTAIAQVVWDNKPAGIETHGSTTANATDSQGVVRAVKFSRGTPVPVYMSYTLSTDPLKFPADGALQVKNAVVAKGLSYLFLGTDVVALVFRAVALQVEGVIDVTSFTLGTAPSPVGTANLVIASRSIAVLDTSRITVT